MGGYGLLVDMRNDTYRWVLDDVLSLQYRFCNTARSRSFVFVNVPFHLELQVFPRDDRLQLSIHPEILSDECFQVSFEMGTGFGGELENRSGRMDKSCFCIKRWMPWSELLKRRLEILQNGCLEVKIKLQKEEKVFDHVNLSSRLLDTDAERTAEEKNYFDSVEVDKISENNGCAEKNKAVSAEDSDDEESALLPKNFNQVRKSLKSLFRSGENSDVTVIVGDREFTAHKCILGMRSPVFKSTFDHEFVEKQTGRLNIDDCDPETFEDFLYHLYTGSISHVHSRNASSLYAISNKYELNELKEVCLSCMKEHLACDTFCDTMSLALLYEEKDLIRLATEFFCEYGLKIMNTVEWQIFMRKKPIEANELFLKYAKRRE